MVELAGDYEFAAPQDLVWEIFLDPEALARVMPGCKKLERVGENEFEGVMNIKVGPVQGVFQGKVTLSDLQPPQSYHLVVNGRGAAGIIRGEGDIQFIATETGTKMSYEGQGQVSGRMATIAQRLMVSSAKSITKQCLQNMDKQIAVRLQPEPEDGEEEEETAVSLPEAPNETEFMLNVAKDVAADLVSDPKQRQLLLGAGLALVVVALINGFANLVARRVAKILKEE